MNNKFQYKFLMSRDEAKQHWLEARRQIGNWLIEFRRNQELNIVDVADALSMSVTTIDEMESGAGKLHLDWLLYICRFYGATIKVTLEEVEGLNYNRDEEHAAARAFRANQPKEEEEDVK